MDRGDTIANRVRTKAVVLAAIAILVVLIWAAWRQDLPGATLTSSAAADEEALRALMTAWDAAYLQQDTAALAAILADDYMLIDAAGRRVTRSEYVIGAVKVPARPPQPASTEDVSVRLYGDAAVVTGRSHVKGLPRGRAQLLGAEVLVTDVFIRKEGRWKAVLTQATSLTP